jgi:hypothetical protein
MSSSTYHPHPRFDRYIANSTSTNHHVAWLERTMAEMQQQHKEEVIHLKSRIERLEKRLTMKEHQLKLILNIQQLLE